jgi:O-antigen/teichoic acid export membrane protein
VAALDEPKRLGDYVRRGLIRSAAIGAVLALLIPVAEPLIVLIYGPDFAQAAVFFRLLVGVVIFDVLLAPFLLLPLAYRRPKLLAAADALRAVTLVLVAASLIPAYGAFGAVVARFAARVGGAILVLGALYSGRRTPTER